MADVPLVLNKFCSKVNVGATGLKTERPIKKMVLHRIKKKDEICKKMYFTLFVWKFPQRKHVISQIVFDIKSL